MELKVNRPALAGQDIDPETFQRVWNRVMPGQAAPAAPGPIPGGAVSEQPAPSPEQKRPPASSALPPVPDCPTLPPVPDCPTLPPVPDCPTLPPVPDCPAQPAPDTPALPPVPDCPTLPPVPDCPAQPAPDAPALPPVPDCPSLPTVPDCPSLSPVPDCPARQPIPDCPARPGCLSRSGTPTPRSEPRVSCLGEASQGDSGQLEALMTLAQAGARAGRTLARRAGGSCARAMSALADDHRMAFRRLSAAYFLITGRRYTPPKAACELPASLPLALRQQFGWEQQWELRNTQAAQAASDPCLRELYLELAQEGALHAGVIRSLLEQMG